MFVSQQLYKYKARSLLNVEIFSLCMGFLLTVTMLWVSSFLHFLWFPFTLPPFVFLTYNRKQQTNISHYMTQRMWLHLVFGFIDIAVVLPELILIVPHAIKLYLF